MPTLITIIQPTMDQCSAGTNSTHDRNWTSDESGYMHLSQWSCIHILPQMGPLML